MLIDLSGIWTCEIPGQTGEIRLPGTLDEAGFGHADDPLRQWQMEEVRRIGFWREGGPIVTRLTRKHAFEGQARISRFFEWPLPVGKRVFVECERARHLRLLVNGREAPLFFSCRKCGMIFGPQPKTLLSCGRPAAAAAVMKGIPC